MSKTFTKQPAEIKDIDVNFDDFFAGASLSGDFLVASGDGNVTSVSVTGGNTGGSGDLLLGPGLRPDFAILAGIRDGIPGHRIKVWIGGGTSGVTYKVTVRAATNGGRFEEEDFRVRVQEK